MVNHKNNKQSKQFSLKLLVIALFITTFVNLGVCIWQQSKINSLNQTITSLAGQLNTTYNAGTDGNLEVDTPIKNSTITSPVSISGQVPSGWAYDGTFPIELLDSSGNVIGQTSASIIQDYDNNAYQPFYAEIEFSGTTPGSGGTIRLLKHNATEQEETADYIDISIKF